MNPTVVGLAALVIAAAGAPVPAPSSTGSPLEFCLDGRIDLGARLQGTRPRAGEFYPARWCVVTEDDSARVRLETSGAINADVESDFAVSYLPPDRVRIVRRDAPPDLDFTPAAIADEASRNRRLDPRRLVEELEANPQWTLSRGTGGEWTVLYPGSPEPVVVGIVDGELASLRTHAELPLRGRVPLQWSWNWTDPEGPLAELVVDGVMVFEGRGAYRRLEAAEVAALWRPSGDQAPREIPGHAWLTRVAMELETLAEGVYRVTGVRTGFHHLVVDTKAGLVVADAPAGWVELHQIPPTDLVPGLGISGLSERMIDFLTERLPGRPLRAVVLTHAHDDHAGGARAFAAAGAEIYAPGAVAEFLERALTRGEMPPDRFAGGGRVLRVIGVGERLVLDDPERPIELRALDGGPHVASALGLWLPRQRILFQSDLHAPGAGAPAPERAASECWFAAWAARELPSDATVLASHSTDRSTVARVAGYLRTPACRQRSNRTLGGGH